ncbi:MAG: peroxidase family protein [Planctomycetota bacterium]
MLAAAVAQVVAEDVRARRGSAWIRPGDALGRAGIAVRRAELPVVVAGVGAACPSALTALQIVQVEARERAVVDRIQIVARSRPGIREQINEITAYIDGSQIYGSDQALSDSLRGTFGSMRTSAGNLLPVDSTGFFVAGDVRVNEQVGLISMHTLFVREHNRLASIIRTAGLADETTWQLARWIVGAELQAITYREFLPVLLGKDALRPYTGFQPNVDPSIANEFTTAAYRLGHSMLSPTLLRLDANGDEIAAGHLALRDAFFDPQLIQDEGIEPTLRGLGAQRAQRIDTLIIDDVRNFLFGPPGSGGFDLASLNLQRGRDHGLANYVDTRQAYGLSAPSNFGDLHVDHNVRQQLQATYGSVANIDLWIGGLAERHVEGAMVGRLFRAILSDQFERLRDGDPYYDYYYERALPADIVQYVERMTLAEIIRANTDIDGEIRDDVFRIGGRHGGKGRRGRHGRGGGSSRTLTGRALELARRMR